VLEKIYYKNFERLVSTKPKTLNPGSIVEECERLISIIETSGGLGDQVEGDASIARMVRSYFKTI
jgi:hypothetical protein